MAASCYSSSQLAAISSTVTELWSISAPVYQWMFIQRTVWAASADTTCNQKGEGREESATPPPPYIKWEKLQGKEKHRKINATARYKLEEKSKWMFYNGMFMVGMHNFHLIRELRSQFNTCTGFLIFSWIVLVFAVIVHFLSRQRILLYFYILYPMLLESLVPRIIFLLSLLAVCTHELTEIAWRVDCFLCVWFEEGFLGFVNLSTSFLQTRKLNNHFGN